MTSLAAPKVALKLVPVPKPALYAGLSGEMLKNTGMKDNAQIQAVQQAVSEGLVAKVIVTAVHPDGRVEIFTLAMKPFTATDTVSLQLENGKSLLETLDVGLAAAVQHAANLITRQGLTPRFSVTWSERAKANPAIITDALRRLNLKVETEAVPAPQPMVAEPVYRPAATPPRYPQTVTTWVAPPPVPPQHVIRPLLTVTPAKDPGVTFTYETTRKVTP